MDERVRHIAEFCTICRRTPAVLCEQEAIQTNRLYSYIGSGEQFKVVFLIWQSVVRPFLFCGENAVVLLFVCEMFSELFLCGMLYIRISGLQIKVLSLIKNLRGVLIKSD